MNQSTLNYVFNLCMLIGFVIPSINLVSGLAGSLFGGGAEADAGADGGIDIDMDMDPGMDVTAGLDVDFDVDMDSGFAMGLDIDTGLDTGMDAGASGVPGPGAAASASSVSVGGPVPFNMMCLCLSLVVFGASGQMAKGWMTATLPAALLLTLCLTLAGGVYWALYTFLIRRLRENDAGALSYRKLKGMGGEVTLRITGDSAGLISLRDSTGAAISFRAKMDPHLKSRMPDTIRKGETVVVTDVDVADKLCYVSVYPRRMKENTTGRV